MDDVYANGIQLALDEGLSAGIAKISSELATLERALVGSEIMLAPLHAFAGGIEISAGAELARPARQGSLVLGPLAPADDVPPSVEETPPVGNQVSPTLVAVRVSQQTADQDHPERAFGVMPAILASLYNFNTAEPDSMGSQVRQNPERQTEAPSWDVQRWVELHEYPAAATPEHDYVPTPKVTPDNRLPLSFAPVREPNQILQTDNEWVDASPFARVAPELPMAPFPRTRANLSQMMSALPLSHSGSSGFMQAPTAAQQPTSTSNPPSQGDVFLDGARVGRWIVNMLAREASRPQSGATPFDARMGPSWPGMA